MTMEHGKMLSKLFLVVTALALIVLTGIPTESRGQPAAIEPKADQLLQKMSDYLGGLQRFSVQTENTLEVVLGSGEKIQYDSPAELLIQRPNKLRAQRKGDIVNQEFYYDGKTFTLHNPDHKYYAQVNAPSTIDETLDFARTQLDVFAPGGDLIYKNAYAILTEDVISGFYVGMIEEGEKPLPRKFVVTTKWMTGAPQFTVAMKNWNVSPKLTEDMFTFVPPKDAQKIDFVRLTSGGMSHR
jgi:hypothetical protein